MKTLFCILFGILFFMELPLTLWAAEGDSHSVVSGETNAALAAEPSMEELRPPGGIFGGRHCS